MTSSTNHPEDAAVLRQRAEAQLQRVSQLQQVPLQQVPQPADLAAMSPAEIQRALHELQVHQLELEMQNEELRRAQVELNLARDRYFDLYDLAPVGYCTLSAEGLILEINLTAATLLGVARGSLLKRRFVSFITFEDQDRFHLLWRKLTQTGVSEPCEVHMLRQGGVIFWAQLETSLTIDAEESPLCRVVFSDISERKQSESVLREALSHADAANQAKSQFLSTMSHEIRTPLNGIIGLTDLLMMASLPPAQAEMIQIVQGCGHSLLAVIGDVLDLAKIESGELELECCDLDIHHLIEEIRGLFAASSQIKGLSLTVNVDRTVPVRLRGDAVRLRQVLINLIGNAVKFTEHGKVTLSVTAIATGSEHISLICVVSDTGPGIPEAYLSRIFNPFSQADASMSRRHGGSGLGLAIAKRLTDLMHGSLTVESRIGEGSWFHFKVPLQLGSPATAAAVATGSARFKDHQRSLTVLVVEDEPVCRFTLTLMLRNLGYRVRVVENGLLAIAAVKESHFDLVLMDCQMPLCDGYTATKTIRKLTVAMTPRRLPIIALTANAFTEDRANCQAAGMDDVLTKPCTVEVLKACLDRWTTG